MQNLRRGPPAAPRRLRPAHDGHLISQSSRSVFQRTRARPALRRPHELFVVGEAAQQRLGHARILMAGQRPHRRKPHARYPPRRGEAPSCGNQLGVHTRPTGAPDRLQALPETSGSIAESSASCAAHKDAGQRMSLHGRIGPSPNPARGRCAPGFGGSYQRCQIAASVRLEICRPLGWRRTDYPVLEYLALPVAGA